jgi:hypothetical protein
MAKNQSEILEEEQKRMNMTLLSVMRKDSKAGITGL